MKDNSSGITGILGIAVCVGLFLAARKFFPSLATLMLWLAGIAGVVIVVLIGLVIYFSVTGKNFAPYWHSPLFIYNTSIVQYGLDCGYKFVSYQLDSMDWIDKNDRKVNSKFYMNNEKLILRLFQNLKPSQTVLFSTGFNGIERDE